MQIPISDPIRRGLPYSACSADSPPEATRRESGVMWVSSGTGDIATRFQGHLPHKE